jgi:hypothetical protein
MSNEGVGWNVCLGLGILGVTMHTVPVVLEFCHLSRRNHILRLLFVYKAVKQDDLWKRKLVICMS